MNLIYIYIYINYLIIIYYIMSNIKNNNTINHFKQLIKTNSMTELSIKLNLSKSTLKRWIDLDEVPANYEFDILKLLHINIDYKKYSSKQKDQFFTPKRTAKYCFDIFVKLINEKYNENLQEYTFIEPSAGDGSFIDIFPSNYIALDIEPRQKNILKQDYLKWKPTNKDLKYIVFGNPPFGLRGHIALQFINHSYDFADYVCFILPQLFESDGKGVPRKRVKSYNLIYSEKLKDVLFYEPNGNIIKINTIFQIWSKNHFNKKYDIDTFTNKDKNIQIYSMSDGGTIASTRNKNLIGKCDVYIPSTCFGKNMMTCYTSFEDLPGRRGYGIMFKEKKSEMINKALNIDWTSISFLSTNSAYNLRTSQINSALCN